MPPKEPPIRLIVGLGNPGLEYAHTRHNAGADAVRLFAKRAGLRFETKRDLFADVTACVVRGKRVILACPTIAMNTSGRAVAALARFFRIAPEGIAIVHDDMDLPFGTIKVVFNRGSGGHKGVESVFRSIKTKAIVRIRIGVMGSARTEKPGVRALEKIVVKKLSAKEELLFRKGVRRAADALPLLVERGRDWTMSEFNR
jgi:PTH1 family peptidyl-tRNA hydrolase